MPENTEIREKPHLSGVFIVPGDNLMWTEAQWREAFAAIAGGGMETVIVQWCVASGRAIYPSEIFDPVSGMAVDDVVGTILSAAQDVGVAVILGLDGSRYLAEIHYEPVEAPAQRFAQVLQEVLARYGECEALDGFYLPQEWSAPPTRDEGQLIIQCATLCRRLRPDLLACTTAVPPKLPVTGRGWEIFEWDPEAYLLKDALMSQWGVAWAEIISRAGLDAVLLRDDVSSIRCGLMGDPEAYISLRRACEAVGCELWGQVGLYDVTHVRADLDPPGLHPMGLTRLRERVRVADYHCDAIIGFSYDYIDPAAGPECAKLYHACRKDSGATVPAAAVTQREEPKGDVPGPLLEKAQAVERIIESRHLLEGQIMTVVDYRYGLDDPHNYWQEDADWMTGLYTGAESLRFAATGDPDARARAQRSFEALCMLSTVSGVPGVVARNFRRSFAGGDLGSGRKRWVKVKGQDLWWGTDISRDQLSGHFFGLAAYHDLVADESERKLIRRLVSDIVGSILEHRMQAVDWDGEYTIHGNFWVAPFQALATLKLAHHITRESRFEQAYQEYISPHFFLGHAVLQARRVLDPFFQHYQYDSPAYHALQYETDRRILRYLVRALDLVYADVKDLGNVYLLFVYQTYRPESDAARRGEAELLQFNPDHLDVPNWRRDVERAVAEYGEELPEQLRVTLEYCLEPDRPRSLHVSSFIPMSLRPPMEFNWQYYAGIQTGDDRAGGRPHGEHVGYSGVDYLLAYWMGRYHGFLR